MKFILLLAAAVAVASEDPLVISLNASNVHWGYFSKNLTPVATIASGQEIVVEMGTHHACDDWDRMIKGDPGMESIYLWNQTTKGEPYRGASGGGDGVHILTGPIYVEDAEPGDLLKVEILNLVPRPNADGKTFGSNAAAWWGYQARVKTVDGLTFTAGSFTKTSGSNDEVVTIYELVLGGDEEYAVPLYQFKWPTITDPMNTTRDYIAYPGTCVPHDDHGDTVVSGDVAAMGWTKSDNITYFDDVFPAKIPINFHIGCMGLAPESHDFVDSIPPMPTGGNLDNKRIGVGTTMYYPVEVAGALLSMGDAHTAQGDSELDGTGIETSITGTFKITVIKKADFTEGQKVVNFPLGETDNEWIVHGFTQTDYLETFFAKPSDIYGNSSIDASVKNAFMQTRKFMMAEYNVTEMEATTIITEGVDFAVTQVVDGNWGVHGVIPKALFEPIDEPVSYISRTLLGESTLPLSAANVHWGYFSKTLEPVLTIDSDDTIIVEMATHHACDDYDKMIRGDKALEEIYSWNASGRVEEKRGATGGGDGVHILTGPIYVNGAEPGDILKVQILGLEPRANSVGRTFGSNAAAWWGFQYRVPSANGTDLKAGNSSGTPGVNDEFVTIYELKMDANGQGFAVPSYQFKWPTITDPMNKTRDYIAYPGTCVPHDDHGDTFVSGDVAAMGWKKSGKITYFDDVFPAKIPINYHIGNMGLAPASHDFVDSIPPMPSGGNLDNKRIGVGTTMYYPVEVAGALLSMGDAHAAQGDSELDGTGIETSITGKFRISVIKKADFTAAQAIQNFPLGETDTEWIVHGFTETDYLETFSSNPSDIYGASSTDKAMMNTFAQTRDFVMAQYGLTENEAWTVITQGVNFGFTQLVDGNWGMHGLVPKAIFSADVNATPPVPTTTTGSGASHNRKFLWATSFITICMFFLN